jgi:ribosome recycling factor
METKFKDINEWLTKEFSGIRTGQAVPVLLDGVKVENYGVRVPVSQVATITIENARTLRLSPWDKSTSKAIEKAIIEADLGVSVAVDDGGLRVIFPELTGERRQQLLKLAKQKLEEARVSVRAVRDEEMKAIDAAQKAGDISEDEKFAKKEKVQKAVDAANSGLESLFTKKEQEIAR